MTWRADVSDAVDPPGEYEIAVDLVLPSETDLAEPAPVLSCLPGGFLTRRYYDMEIGDRNYTLRSRPTSE